LASARRRLAAFACSDRFAASVAGFASRVSLRGLPPDPCADRRPAAALAAEQVRAVEDSPAERRRVAAAFYAVAGRRAFGRAELRFLHWEIGRGVLNPVRGPRPGSPWWRAVNARLLRDKVEADLLACGGSGRPSSSTVALWLAFVAGPTPLTWYRAHNASIAAAYLDHEALARSELPAERFVMNVALARVLFTHAMLARPRLALGRLAALGPRLADPRRGAVDLFLDLRRPFPEVYPLTGITVAELVAREGRVPRAIDDGVIVPRLAAVYDHAADTLGQPGLLALVDGGAPCYGLSGAAPDTWSTGAGVLPRLAALVSSTRMP
jgi:hypothetical protein